MAYKPIGSDRRFQRVSSRVELLPSLTASGDIYKRGGMEYTIASLGEVKAELKAVASKAYAKAQANLAHTRAELGTLGKRIATHVSIELKKGRIDSYLILNDMASGTPGAMSIEFGRDAYEVEDEETGEKHIVGGMTGKGFLHRAFGLRPGSLNGTGGGDIGV